jgi:hypothetical protein
MRRFVSLVLGVTVTAMAIAVPVALGEGRVGPLEPQAVPSESYYVDAGDRAVLVQPGVRVDRRTDSFDRDAVTTTPTTYRDAGDRAVHPTTGNTGYVDANERGSVPTVVVATTGSGVDIAWPQVGAALVIGIALGIGLLYGLRSTHHGPLAH